MSIFLTANDLIDESIFDGFIGAHNEVAIGIGFDAFDGLSGMPRENVVQHFSHAHDFFGLQIDVSGLSGDAAAGDERLMNQDSAVWE